MNDRLIRYGEARALEHAAYALGRTPTRIVKLLLPVHRVEIQATVTEARPYALIDRYLEHGIAEGRLGSVAELAAFYSLDENLVDRAIRFLVAIGHVQDSGGMLALTELGYRSVRDDMRYEVSHQDRHTLYFDGYGSRPLSRRYYGSGRVTFLSLTDRYGWFKPVMSTRAFQPGALTELARNPQRDRYNLPGRLDDLELLDTGPVFLPAYVVRTLGPERCVVYTQIGDEDDTEITAMYGPELAPLLDVEENATEGGLDLPRARSWLADNGLSTYEPVRRADGTWQVVLPAKVFSKTAGEHGLPSTRLGSFIVLRSDVLHIWCRDERVRYDALLRRADAYLLPRPRIDASDFDVWLTRLTRQLDLGRIDLATLRQTAENAGLHGLATRLSRLS